MSLLRSPRVEARPIGGSALLEEGYRRSAQLTRRHGTTYYWGTQLLTQQQRRDVYAVYALCRLADDIVDEPDVVEDVVVPTHGDPAQRLSAFEADFREALTSGSSLPVMAAIVDTVRRRDIPLDCFERFFAAMRLDLTRTSWATWAQLRDDYMEGSAAVIGEMMLPVLQPPRAAEAKQPARALGLAFQLTNFIRDVSEDLDRGRVYLPADDLARHGADVWSREVTPEWRAFLVEQIERNRELYRAALPGVEMLPAGASRCVGVALRMYAEILVRIERADYDVFSERRRVSAADKSRIVAEALARGPVAVARGFDHGEGVRESAGRGSARGFVRGAGARGADDVDAAQRGATRGFDIDAGVAAGQRRPAQQARLSRLGRSGALSESAVGEPGLAALLDCSAGGRGRGEVGARENGVMPALRRPDIPLRRVPQPDEAHMRSTWRQAAVPRIERALKRSQERDPGGWYVVGASGDVGRDSSIVRTVLGREIVLWRDESGAFVAGPGECPHMGARLDACPVVGSELLCRWHGLAMPAAGDRLWAPYPAHDDGVLLWVRLDTPGETPAPAPRVPDRPDAARSLASVIVEPGVCEPKDVIANRLDPWHGAWFHPYAFSHLVVDDDASTDDCLVTDVTFRLNRTWGVPVRAEFTCPDARTIAMHITDGEGTGSVVETHATPLGLDRDGHPVTMVTEATIAFSPRPGFALARHAAPLIEPLMRRTQRRLWVDDLAYAERRYTLRARRG